MSRDNNLRNDELPLCDTNKTWSKTRDRDRNHHILTDTQTPTIKFKLFIIFPIKFA